MLKRTFSTILSLIILLSAVSVNAFAASGIKGVVINEVCSSNKKSLKDSQGDSPDWIELYNTTKSDINLKGARLSDGPDNPGKWVFPDVTIGAGKYLIVFASDKQSTKSELHTGYKLSGGKDSVVLSSADGKVVDSVLLPDTKEDETYGRSPDGTGDFVLMTPTPKASNSGSKQFSVAAPIFSHASGFYANSFKLTITAGKDLTVYYTTDGSVPTSKSKKYSSPISVIDLSGTRGKLMYKTGTTVDGNEGVKGSNFDMGTVIRAIAIDSKGRKSDVTTSTYFVGNKIAEKYKNVAVISVVTDPDGLYNYKDGIFVRGAAFDKWRKENPTAELNGGSQANYNQRGREWEREAHVDFFDGTKLGFSTECGIRTQGGWSRANQQKSLKFYMRSEYGDSKLDYKLFEDNFAYDDGKEIKSYKKFAIRNGGNDTFVMTFKCPWTQSLVRDLNFATQNDRLVVCFLDGEYWGHYTLNEVYDSNFIESNYGVPKDEAIMIKAGKLEDGVEGDEKLFWDAMSFIEWSDMTKAENYAKACELFDMDSFLDYMAAEIYIGNQDWVWGNWACWRSRTVNEEGGKYHDGRWRFMLYDTEFSMDLYNSGRDYKMEFLSQLIGEKKDGSFANVMTSLLKNSDFKKRFIVTMEKVGNVCFEPTYASAKLDEYYKTYSPFLSTQFQRFGNISWQSAGNVRNNVQSFKGWLDNRLDYLPTLLKNNLKLSSSKTNKLSVSLSDANGGKVYLEGTAIRFTNGKWSGNFIPGYKFKLKAVPAEGYKFTGWSGSSNKTSDTIEINPTTAINLKTNFEKVK